MHILSFIYQYVFGRNPHSASPPLADLLIIKRSYQLVFSQIDDLFAINIAQICSCSACAKIASAPSFSCQVSSALRRCLLAGVLEACKPKALSSCFFNHASCWETNRLAPAAAGYSLAQAALPAGRLVFGYCFLPLGGYSISEDGPGMPLQAEERERERDLHKI